MSLSTRLLIAINSICFILLIGLGSFVIVSKRTEAMASLDNRISSIGTYIAKVAGFYMWNLDTTSLQTMKDDLEKDDAVEFVNFYDKDGKPAIEEKTAESKSLLMHETPIEYTGQGTIGKLTISYNRNSIDSAFKAALWQTLLAVILCQLTISLIVGYIIKKNLKAVLSALTEIEKTSETTSETSQSLKQVFQVISDETTKQASAIEETVASLEEITAVVKQSSDSAQIASKGSGESAMHARSGREVIQDLNSAMKDISDSSKRIQEITGVIDDIAFQTNLLALNAAVEAARAGEQGRGFAVVADAVRNLSQRSAAAAKDIDQMIKESVSKIQHGLKALQTNEQVFDKIADGVEKISTLNEAIYNSVEEQNRGLVLISQAMNQIDNSTQETASNSAKVSESSEELAEQANRLKSLVKELNQTVTGKSA